jgi:hypothetical protein
VQACAATTLAAAEQIEARKLVNVAAAWQLQRLLPERWRRSSGAARSGGSSGSHSELTQRSLRSSCCCSNCRSEDVTVRQMLLVGCEHLFLLLLNIHMMRLLCLLELHHVLLLLLD